jgi:hypothetical protein
VLVFVLTVSKRMNTAAYLTRCYEGRKPSFFPDQLLPRVAAVLPARMQDGRLVGTDFQSYAKATGKDIELQEQPQVTANGARLFEPMG